MTPTLRVLIIDDSEQDAAASARELVRSGFRVRYKRVWNADLLRAALGAGTWDVVIGDYASRGIGGTAALRVVRQHDADLPFIFVSGTAGEDAAVDAMKAGAHDYMRKGGLQHLAAAVRHEVREASTRREHRRMALRVAHLAYHDALTDLPNRTLLHDRLAQAIRAGHRAAVPVSLLVLDLDGFKEVNDAYGHRAGDRTLQQIAARLRGVLRDVDTVARLGGDEFAVVLPSTGLEGAIGTAAKVLEQVQLPCAVGHRQLTVHASVGIAWFPEHAKSADLLLKKADLAMFLAKANGGGIAVYGSKPGRALRRRRSG